ncbi:MAG: right-handed parallel beta-helix repeat-containing protein [Desulfobacterales bacterium]
MTFKKRWFQTAQLLILVLTLTLVFACSSDDSGGGDEDNDMLLSISVNPADPSISAGDTQQFSATGTYSDTSTRDITAQVAWTSYNLAVATIDDGGLASAITVGTSTITATLSGASGVTMLTVTSGGPAPDLVSIAVTPANPSISAGNNQQFKAIGTFSDASTEDISAQVSWSSSNTGVATIDGSGYAAAIAEGTATISAELDTITASATLTVTPFVIGSRGPIIITADDQFTPVNGVVRGSGTLADPYVIEGWSIDASTNDINSWPYIKVGIGVYQTTKYFVIQDCHISNSADADSGILLSYLDNGTVQNCTITDSYSGISLGACTNVLISGNTIENCEDGVSNDSSSSDRITISGNTISDCTGTGIYFHYLTNSSAIGNTVTNNESGIYASALWSGNCTISNNTVQGNAWKGIEVDDDSQNNTISGNNTSSNEVGIAIYGSNNTISGNTSNANSWTGILLDYTGLTVITANGNTVSGNTANNNGRDGLYVGTGCINNTISDNIFTGNNTVVGWYYDININAQPNTLSGNTYGTSYIYTP